MPIANITYKSVVDEVKNWIKANCKNISNYASIKGEFKSGWSKSEPTISGGKTTKTWKITLTSGGVISYSVSDVDNDMKTFCENYCGLTTDKMSKRVSEDEFYHLVQNMISFICTKCNFVCSQYAQETRYLVYKKDNNSFSTTFNISSDKTQRLIYAMDAKSLMATMLDVVNQNLRCSQCVYKLELSN